MSGNADAILPLTIVSVIHAFGKLLPHHQRQSRKGRKVFRHAFSAEDPLVCEKRLRRLACSRQGQIDGF